MRWNLPENNEESSTLESGDSGIIGYRIYRFSQSDTGDWEQYIVANIFNKNDTDFIDTDLIGDSIYYYRISAFDSHITNNRTFYNKSWYSDILSVKTRKNNTAPETPVLILPLTLPPPHTSFVLYGRTLNQRPKLIWKCPVDADSDNLHFKVYCDTGEGNTLLANSAVDTQGFTYFNGVSYDSFTITGIDSSVYGNTICFKPLTNLNDTVYCWTIQASDSKTFSDSAIIRYFRIGGRDWTDSNVTAGSTPIRKIHIEELREEINYARRFRNLANIVWTDTTIIPGVTLIRKTHIDELRSALEQAISAGFEDIPVWSDPILTPGVTSIRKIHFDELRLKLKE